MLKKQRKHTPAVKIASCGFYHDFLRCKSSSGRVSTAIVENPKDEITTLLYAIASYGVYLAMKMRAFLLLKYIPGNICIDLTLGISPD